jgi:hypothetical protein
MIEVKVNDKDLEFPIRGPPLEDIVKCLLRECQDIDRMILIPESFATLLWGAYEGKDVQLKITGEIQTVDHLKDYVLIKALASALGDYLVEEEDTVKLPIPYEFIEHTIESIASGFDLMRDSTGAVGIIALREGFFVNKKTLNRVDKLEDIKGEVHLLSDIVIEKTVNTVYGDTETIVYSMGVTKNLLKSTKRSIAQWLKDNGYNIDVEVQTYFFAGPYYAEAVPVFDETTKAVEGHGGVLSWTFEEMNKHYFLQETTTANVLTSGYIYRRPDPWPGPEVVEKTLSVIGGEEKARELLLFGLDEGQSHSSSALREPFLMLEADWVPDDLQEKLYREGITLAVYYDAAKHEASLWALTGRENREAYLITTLPARPVHLSEKDKSNLVL